MSRLALHAEAALVTFVAFTTLGFGVVLLGLMAAFGGEALRELLGRLPGGRVDTHVARPAGNPRRAP